MQVMSKTSMSSEELEGGIVSLYCLRCQKVTKHKTLIKPPVYRGVYRPKVSREELIKRCLSHPSRKKRMCLECGNITKF